MNPTPTSAGSPDDAYDENDAADDLYEDEPTHSHAEPEGVRLQKVLAAAGVA